LQVVVGKHRRHGDQQAERGHDQRFTDRTRDLVDRGRTGDADRDQRAVDANHGTEQADERRSRTDRGEERQATGEAGVDRSFRARQRTVQPVMRFERVHLADFVFGLEAIVNQLPPGAVLVELGSAFAQGRRIPERRIPVAALAQDLRLFDPLGEQDEE
jgi:hypothetical protein